MIVLSERFTPVAFRGINASYGATKKEGVGEPEEGTDFEKKDRMPTSNLCYRNLNFPKSKSTAGERRA